MEKVLYKIAHLCVRFRWIVIVLWVGLAIFTGAKGPLPQLANVVSTSNSAFLPASSPSMQASQLAAPFTPTAHPTGQLVVTTSTGSVAPSTVLALEKSIQKVPGVIAVKSSGRSQNGKASLAVVTVNTPPQGDQTNAVVKDIRAAMANTAVPPGTSAALTGTIAINADAAGNNALIGDIISGGTFGVILLILALVYRSFIAPILNLLPSLFVLGVSAGVVGQLVSWGLPGSSITEFIMTVLILGAGTDSGLFVMMRFREEMETTDDVHEAVARAVAKVGEAIVFAALTVSAALGCLYFSSFGIYKGIGPALAVAILIMLLASLTLMPAILGVAGRRAFWPSKPRTNVDSGYAKVAEACAKRPAITLSLGVVILALLSVAVFSIQTNGFNSNLGGPPGSQSESGYKAINENFPASVTGPTSFVFAYGESVWTLEGLTKIQAAESQLAQSTLIATTSGPFAGIQLEKGGTVYHATPALYLQAYQTWGPPADLPITPPASLSASDALLYSLYQAEGVFFSNDGKTVQLDTTLKAGPPNSDAAIAEVPQLRTLATSVGVTAGAQHYGLAGLAPLAFDIKDIAQRDLIKILPIVILVIAILLGLLLRSLIAPIFLILTVVLSYLSTLGITVLLFQTFGSEGGVNFILPFLLFVFLIALGEDYNILVMSRIREEWPHSGDHKARTTAVVRAVGATGGTVTSAGVILAGGFIMFGVAGIIGNSPQLTEIGFALAIGIFLDTFVVRTLLVPSIVQLLGNFTWWPSALGHEGKPSTPKVSA